CMLLLCVILNLKSDTNLKEKINLVSKILLNIYTDSYFKFIFEKDYFLKYNTFNYGLDQKSFPFKNMTEGQKKVIENIKTIFGVGDTLFKGEIPENFNLPCNNDKERFDNFQLLIFATLDLQSDEDFTIFFEIAEALAFIKIKKIK